MKVKRPRQACAVDGAETRSWSCSLLVLPMGLLHQVLGPHDLLKLLQTSRAMAVEVMQHSAGRLTFKVKLYKGVKLTAIRQLQWAPQSALKLELDAYINHSPAKYHWNSLLHALHEALPDKRSHQEQHIKQLPCIAEAYIHGFVLPELVPPGLAAIFPNLRQLRLGSCEIQHDKGATTVSSSSTGIVTGDVPALHLHTLDLRCVEVPLFEGLELANGDARVTRSMQSAVQNIQQLRNRVPNVTCLKLLTWQEALPVLPVLAPQLTELHLPSSGDMSYWWQSKKHLQNLQRLELPGTWVSETDFQKLLSLPNLAHMEVDSVSSWFEKDYSSYPCRWQSLHLYLFHDKLHLETLAKLPLQSLTQPLKLSCDDYPAMVKLPSWVEEDVFLEVLGRLAQQLMKCGVQVMGSHVLWTRDIPDDEDFPQGLQLASAIRAIGPALGLHARITMLNIIVDQAILEALASVYSSSLRQLHFDTCGFQEGILTAWQAALSGLPALVRLNLVECFYCTVDQGSNSDSDEGEDGNTAMARAMHMQVAAAMAQQPEGRHIEIDDYYYKTPQNFAAMVKNGEEAMLADVEVTPMKIGEYCDPDIRDVTIRITSRRRS